MLREVVLHGELARRYGKVHRFDVASPAEAVRALCANFKGLDAHLSTSQQRGVGYQVWDGGQNVGEDALQRRGSGRIYISPVLMGSKRGGIFQLILGAVLVVVGAVVDVYSGGTAGNPLIAAGAAMFIGGIATLLGGVVKGSGKDTRSYYFNGPANTTGQGNPVPVGYGTLMIGGAVISAAISLDRQVVAGLPAANPPNVTTKGTTPSGTVRGKGSTSQPTGAQAKST